MELSSSSSLPMAFAWPGGVCNVRIDSTILQLAPTVATNVLFFGVEVLNQRNYTTYDSHLCSFQPNEGVLADGPSLLRLLAGYGRRSSHPGVVQFLQDRVTEFLQGVMESVRDERLSGVLLRVIVSVGIHGQQEEEEEEEEMMVVDDVRVGAEVTMATPEDSFMMLDYGDVDEAISGDEVEQEDDFLANLRVVEDLEKQGSGIEMKDCSICLEELKEGDDVSEAPCKHRFHSACIRRWLFQSECCPLCRFRCS